MKRIHFAIILCVFALVSMIAGLQVKAQAGGAGQLEVLNKNRSLVSKITDGDLIRLRFRLPDPIQEETTVIFSLDGPELEVASCAIPAGKTSCESEALRALGWRWTESGSPQRTVLAAVSGPGMPTSLTLDVTARPVVMVHGFSSNYIAWEKYLGPGGYLASAGIPGFAVGDGQVEGVMNTGSLTDPTGETNTIAENAAILGEYIQNVKKLTGAEQVDLLGHSMGGMISRFYIDRVMQERDVVQLIMLGTPALGSDCANLPAALGFYLPATLEIRPMYAREIFNRQITHRHGVPFYALAGNPILEPLGSPCTPVPSDLVVSKSSVAGIELHLSESPFLHVDLNTSRQVFEEYVLPLLKKGAGEHQDEPDPSLPAATSQAQDLQFTRVYTGHIDPGGSQDLTIPIDAGVTVASFALFDSSRSLDVTVRGANGNVIELDPVSHGLVQVDDPTTLVYLGYGFANPRPGAWQVTLQASDRTPENGSDFALTARFEGGARLVASSSALLPQPGEDVQLNARLELAGQPLQVEQAQVLVRAPDGELQTLQLTSNGDQLQATWSSDRAGLYGIDINVAGRSSDGLPVERAAFLIVQVQPERDLLRLYLTLAGFGLGLLLGMGLLFVVVVRAIRRRKRARR